MKTSFSKILISAICVIYECVFLYIFIFCSRIYFNFYNFQKIFIDIIIIITRLLYYYWYNMFKCNYYNNVICIIHIKIKRYNRYRYRGILFVGVV